MRKAEFLSEDSLRAFWKKQRIEWKEVGIKSLRFRDGAGYPLQDVPLLEPSGVLLQSRTYVLPVDSCALRSVFKALNISGRALRRMPVKDLCCVLNKCVKAAPKRGVRVKVWNSCVCGIYTAPKEDWMVRLSALPKDWAFCEISHASLTVQYQGPMGKIIIKEE